MLGLWLLLRIGQLDHLGLRSLDTLLFTEIHDWEGASPGQLNERRDVPAGTGQRGGSARVDYPHPLGSTLGHGIADPAASSR